MGEDQRAGAGGEHQQLPVDPWNQLDHGYHNARTGNGGDRGGTCGDADHRRHQPGEEDRRNLRIHRQVADHVTHAAGDQHLLEAAAGADDQHDRGGGRETLVQQLEEALGGKAAGMAEGVERQQQGEEEGADGVADHVHPGADHVPFGEYHVGEGLEQHQEHRQQHGGQGHAEAGQVAGLRFVGELLDQLGRRATGNAPGDETAEQRAGDDGGGQRHDQAVEDGLADIRTEHADGQQRAGVRRHQAVDHREAGEQRDADLDQRHPGTPRDDEHQGYQQDEADLEEQRDAHQEGRQHHRPLHAFLAEGLDQRTGDLVGAAGFGHQLAEHGAQGEDHADEAEDAAEAFLEGFDDLLHRHARGQAEEAGGDDQGNEGVELEAGDQDDQADDGDHRIQQQVGVMGEGKHRYVSSCHCCGRAPLEIALSL
ncbi:hypothetical protein FQZ97_625550 [compost metagenome]